MHEKDPLGEEGLGPEPLAVDDPLEQLPHEGGDQPHLAGDGPGIHGEGWIERGCVTAQPAHECSVGFSDGSADVP